MASIRETIEVDRLISEVFDAVADFTTTADWDPGVRRSVQVAGNVVALGPEFDVDLAIPGLIIPPTLRYRITVHDRPDHVVLETEGPIALGRDDVTFSPAPGGGTTIEWTADFRIRGPLGRLVDPVLGLAFRRAGQRAVDGLAEWLRAGGTAAVSGTAS